MYTPDGKIEPIPGTAFGVLPVRLYKSGEDHRTQPTGYVLIEWTDKARHLYIVLPGLFLAPFGAVREAVLLVDPNIVYRNRDDTKS